MNNLPFTEHIKDGELIRIFDEYTDPEEFKWHRDQEDREIYPIEPTDWKFQFEDQVPFIIENKIFISKEIYHRVIKGTGSLKIVLKKY